MRDTPIRLRDAVALFPDTGLTVASLRVERDKGNLVTMIVAGKEFTTRAAIEEMFVKCAVTPKGQGSGSDPNDKKAGGSPTVKSGSSETGRARSALASARQIVQRLKSA